jgi:hypothetical protein
MPKADFARLLIRATKFRRVGRRNDGADQQPAGPGSGEEQYRRRSDDRGRGDYTDGSQGERRPQRTSDGTRIGA